MGSGKVRELGLKLGTPEAQQCYMSARCSQGFNILRLTTLFCVIVFNLIHSLLMVLYNYSLCAVMVILSTPQM